MREFVIRFQFEVSYINKKKFEDVFKKIVDALNIQFDEEFKPYVKNDAVTDSYGFRDVSNLSGVNIKKISDSFFNFTFDDIINVPLYKFLVLKNKDKLTVLANIHSLIFDYTSINAFYNLFNNINNLDSINLENNIISYYDDFDSYLNSSDFKNDSQYWNNHIFDGLNSQKLYNIKSKNYRNKKISLNDEKIFSFLNEHDIPRFNFILAIFSLYLSRIDSTNLCLLKTIIPSNMDDLGPFDRNALLKIEFNKENSFDEYLKEVNHVLNDVDNCTKVDIENYVEEDLTYYSIYDFSKFDNIDVLNGEGFALTLNLHKDYLELIYNEDLFSDIYIEHMMDNIMSLIDRVIDSPNQKCCDIDIISSNEQSLISDFCHGDEFEFDKDKNLALIFRENANLNPNKLAIDDGVNKISYGQLERSSNSICCDLRENYGIDFGEHIGLMLPRTYHFPEMVLSLNKIGAAFVPIDVEYPIKRIKQMMEISESKYLITTRDIAQNLDLNVDVICIEDLNSNLDCDVEIKGKGDDLFAIMFTSGTTGVPKGVMVPNKQLCGLAISCRTLISTQDPCDTVGIYSSFSFTATDHMFWALYFGNSCRIFNEREKDDFLLFINALEECPIHSLVLPSVLIKPILENPNIDIDCLISAGSKINELSSINPNQKLFNAYGSTEAKPTLNLCDFDMGNFSCGKPLDNTWVYILDENSMQMPVGVPGEICISTDILSKGYINNSNLTNERYVDNPYCDCEYNKKLYRTGDIGFYNFDGNLEVIGRNDDQLSVRGFRIESDEIFNIMNRYEAISNIVLDVDNDNLIAYYTTNDDFNIDEVKNALKSELPNFMVPSLFIKLDEIPLNVNGKIDKSALKNISRDVSNVKIDDEIFKCVADSFKEALDTNLVLPDDDFVSLGGNSLSAMKVQLLLKEKLNVHLFSNEIMNLSTPNKISNYIKFGSNVYNRVGDANYTFDDGCPLSDSQLNVYLDESVNDKGTAYNNPFIIRFNKQYSPDEIKKAISKLIEVYPILKSKVLIEDDSLPVSFFDAEIEIDEGSLNDIEYFVRPFELDKCLSRFMMVEDDESTVLCCDFHHLIFDGTSLNILLDSLISLLNNEDIDFVDNGILRQVSFERDIDSHYMDNARALLDNMLSDRDEVYELLPCVDSNGESVFDDVVYVDESILSSFLKSNSITHNQFFTSVFAYSLSRFSGSSKVLFNLIENGRGHFDLSKSVGMFVRTLPLLLDCKNQSVSSFLKNSSNTINSLMENDFYPFHVLANEYDLNSDILFQYSHDIFRYSFDDNWGYKVDELNHGLQGDLSFFIFDYGQNQFGIKIKYSDKFSHDFIKRFTESYKLILQEMLCRDKLDELNYISESDLEILDNINKTQHDLDYYDVLDAFNDNLAKCPSNALVSMGDRVYSYGEGAFVVDRIAKQLIDLGVGSQDCVAFLTERSEIYMFSVLAILSIGGVYVPLDDELPDERIKFMLNDTEAGVVIVSDETYCRAMDLLDDLNNENVVLFNISDVFKDEIGTLDSLPVVYGDLACILYTSGTTGLPKGVKITRKAILNFAEFYVNESGMNETSIYGLFASIGFDVAIKGIFSSIYSGACLNVVPEDIKLDMGKLNGYFAKYGVTHTHITTQVVKLFLTRNEDISLTELVTGGEKLGEIENTHDCRFVDTYGPTEACVYVTSINENDKIDSSSVGHLLSNLKAYVLDENLNRVPFGAVGELFLAGYQIAEGYLNRDDETAKSFFKNPFDGDEEYSVIYRTGDMARFLPDGSLGIVGRRDNQVKIRGNRVELSEIESVIREIDYVEDVTVQIIKNGANSELVAYLVVNRDLDYHVLKENISDYVRIYKPDYMVPSFLIKLNEIPLNINGKVNRNALPKVDFDSLHSVYVAPSTENEKVVVAAFEKIFHHKIGLYDDFAVLGGNSLTAIKLLQYLDNPIITAADILTLRTPYAISRKINDNSFNLDLYNLDDGCPLTESQLNVYLDIIVNNKIDSYIIPVTLDISKEHSSDELCDALRQMVEVHPILGMCVNDNDGVPHLVKGEEPQIIVKSEVDEEYVNDFKTKTFDLTDSLCRFLITENDGDTKGSTLYAVFHHLIFDGSSIFVFEKDLLSILNGESEIKLDDSFLKVSRFNKRMSETEQFKEAHDFFSSMFADYDDANELLGDIDSNNPGSCWFDLSFDKTLFTRFLKMHNISENVLFTGIFAYALSRFTGSDKVLFNILENGRDRFNNYDAIGMFVNTLPLVVDCKSQEISSFMNSMFDEIYNVMKYNYYPFRFLANEFDFYPDIIFQFRPDWLKNHVTQNTEIVDIDGLINDMSDFISDFVCEVIQMGDDYGLRITYSNKYSISMINRFSQVFNLILSQIINYTPLDKINYLPSSDLELLEVYNETEKELKYNDILDAFLENLSKHPNNKLVSMDDRSYTYAEGAYIINEIVNRLKDLNVKSQDNVSFFVDRSEWYLFAPLAILSMGCVYVPLDDAYPDERIKLILEDTQSKVVIVTDNTYERAKDLVCDCTVLNVSNILNGDVKSLNTLNVGYGHLACIIYTSGTTGVPKGVKITRSAILNASSVYVDKYRMSNDDAYGFYVSIGFDVGSLALWATICAGASMVIIPEEIKLDVVKLNDCFVRHNVTYSAITAQVAKLFMQNIKDTSLKVLSVGGEKLGQIESPDYQVIDEFGPTEAFAFVSSINTLDKIDSSSVGSLNYNTKAYILDNEYRRVPYGAVGELYLAGRQLADGYLNRDEETTKSFFTNPFEDDGNYNQMYRTGDLVRLLPDGSIAILGRRDRQVKIRGNRVELPEIEVLIRELEYVNDVTVQTIKNGTNNELVAYVVLSQEIDDVKDYICNNVSKNKPNYMVPSFVVCLDEIPLTVNGKVDMRKLPSVDVESEQEYEYPVSFIEKAIANGFSQVLNISRPISRYDEFNALGGDSISVMMLIVKLREINLHVSVKDVLENQSVKKIAEKVGYKLSVTNVSQEPYFGFVNQTPITTFFWNLKLNNPSYFNQALLFECSERIDMDILRKAMRSVVNHHDILRSKVRDGRLYVGEINDDDYFTLEKCNPSDYRNETERIHRGIDIFNGPLIKLGVFEEENADYLYIVIHHLIVDGISWRIIPEDLNLAYLQALYGDEMSLPTKTNSYQDYALAIDKYRNNSQVLKQKEFWENVLNELMNVKHTEIGENPRKMQTILLKYSKEKTSILFTNAIKEYNASINGLFLSAIVKAWKNVTGENRLSIRVESHGREDFDENLLIERTVGWFSTGYPLILKCEGDENNEIIENVEKILGDVPQNGFAYPILMGIETDVMPLLTFNYLGEINGIKTGEMFVPKSKPNLAPPIALENDFGCDININGLSIDGQPFFELKYDSNRFNHELIEDFANEILKTLDEFVEYCDEDDYSDDMCVFSSHPNKKNLFIIHSANFGSEFFYYLAEQLKEDYSFYVIEPYNLNHMETPLTSVEEFAHKYIDMIKSIQPEGPYYFGGFCFGGSIAHEMSIELKKQNEKVEKLIIFDANYIEDHELQKLLIEHQILYAYNQQQGGVLNPKGISIGDMAAQAKLAGSIWLNYKPNYYEGDVIFFKSSIKPKGIDENLNKMYDYLLTTKAGGFEDYYDDDKLKIVDVPVEHDRIFSEKGLEIIIPEIKKFIGKGDL